MIVKLYDDTEIIVTRDEADRLEQSLQRDKDGIVKIKQFVIKKSAIAYIKPGGMTEADVQKAGNHKQLLHDNRSDEEQYHATRKKVDEVRKTLEKKWGKWR